MVVKLQTGGTTTAVGGSSGAKSGFINSSAYSAIANGVGGVFDSIPTPNQELNETNNTMANIRGTVSSGLMMSGNPYAMAAGVALKVIDKTGGFVDASKGLGGTNDTLNAVASLALPGAGWFARKTENYKISADMKAMASGYASAMKHNQTAQQNAGAKILFGFNKAQSMIHAAKVKDRMISNIKQGADEDMQTAATMTQAKAMQNQYDYLGGYNQALARAAKDGAKLEQIIRVKKLLTKPKEIEEFKEGGNLPEEFVPTTEEQDLDFFNNLTFEDPKVEEEVVQPEETVEQKEEEVQEFKDGGAVNVIPEGNLHARLHHMEDAEGLTKKGVPVVDKDGNQQAEIELNEIILHLELTKKLEELCNKFYNEETKSRDKEDLAIEAGKLLAKEIMENTEDRTGLMNEVA